MSSSQGSSAAQGTTALHSESAVSHVAPKPPAQISTDGREVWAWAEAFSKHTHRMNRLRELRSDLFMCGRECGDCDKWMKSRECPREHNVNGTSRGPSCKSRICAGFVLSRPAAQRRDRLTAEIAELSETPAPAGGVGRGPTSTTERQPEPREDH